MLFRIEIDVEKTRNDLSIVKERDLQGVNMKLKLLITILLICYGQIINVLGQTKPERFFVKYITLETDPNPRFVWRLANKIISFDKESNSNEIACLKKELIKTGLFSKIEPRLYKLKESDYYELILTIKYSFPNPVYKVNGIKLSGFNDVDESKFKQLLASENLIGKSVILKTDYIDFEDKIIELVKKSISDETKQNKFDLPWLIFKVNNGTDLEVTVMPTFQGCSESSR